MHGVGYLIGTNVGRSIVTLADAERLAARTLPKPLFDKMMGSGRNPTVAENERVFHDVTWVPRAGVGAFRRDLSTTVIGTEVAMPILLSCPGGSRMYHPDGELGVARAAHSMGTINVVAMGTGHSIEEIRAASDGSLWQQIYMALGRDAVEEVIDRATACRYGALVVTVDMPLRSSHQGALPHARLTPRAMWTYRAQAVRRPRWSSRFVRDALRQRALDPAERRPVTPGAVPARLRTGLAQPGAQLCATWDDLDWIRDRWGGPLVVKGVLVPDDARRAVAAGAAAVIVSNHGGMGVSGLPTSLEMLPRVVDAVADSCEVLMDSGVRSGSDAGKAISLGARAVLIGRPYLMGLAANGEAGVRDVLRILRHELDWTIGSLGFGSIAELSRTAIRFPADWIDDV
jgi:isopentenyl diphosphate isomerase/L-lactate dehydrogenase-like FMN-dependent dehydrogenase